MFLEGENYLFLSFKHLRLFGGCRDTNVLQILVVGAAGGGGGGGSIFGGHSPH